MIKNTEVKLDKEQAEYMEYLKCKIAGGDESKYSGLVTELIHGAHWNNHTHYPLRRLSRHEFITALYVGYERKYSPEELIQMRYEEAVLKNNQEVADTLQWVIATLDNREDEKLFCG